ncbi:nuclear factor NF-kappa-B p105 subunit [Platysternon megacephalum]|uniref:Nuclear factor NF-kappa-B p105 subunit n=1 Tax=Platysternon megacephalum TaxID=55544 RepID=A0A4D9F3Y2_9SAUR|nr:nuclear factor NF-kappa-B p105 subunit [Platysternon megacephalum]
MLIYVIRFFFFLRGRKEETKVCIKELNFALGCENIFSIDFNGTVHVHLRAKFGLTLALVFLGILIQSNMKNTEGPILLPKMSMSKFLKIPMGAGLGQQGLKFYPNLHLVQFPLTPLGAQGVNQGRIWHTDH